MRRFVKIVALALALLLTVYVAVFAPVQAQNWQKNKNCFWSYHQGTFNWCDWWSACSGYCVRNIVWFGECMNESGWRCRNVTGPVWVSDAYTTCDTRWLWCDCKSPWTPYTGWFMGRTCEASP